MGGVIVVGGTVTGIVGNIEPSAVIMGPIIGMVGGVVTGGSSALTCAPPIGMLNTANIPKNKLVNKTTTTRLNKVSVHSVGHRSYEESPQQASVANHILDFLHAQ